MTGHWVKESRRGVWQTWREWGTGHRVEQAHKRLVPNMSWQLDAWPWLDVSTPTPSVHLHPFYAKSFRYNSYSSKKKEEEGGGGFRSTLSKRPPIASQVQRRGLEWGAVGIMDNLHTPQGSSGQTDTFTFRLILLSVNDRMLRGVSEESLGHLFLLPC